MNDNTIGFNSETFAEQSGRSIYDSFTASNLNIIPVRKLMSYALSTANLPDDMPIPIEDTLEC